MNRENPSKLYFGVLDDRSKMRATPKKPPQNTYSHTYTRLRTHAYLYVACLLLAHTTHMHRTIDITELDFDIRT